MSEIDLDSPKLRSIGEGRSSTIMPWGDPTSPEEDEVPQHLFLSPTLSGSAPSSISHSSHAKKRRRKKLTHETSFNNENVLSQSSKFSFSPKKENENSETLISFASHEQDYSSSDSEDLFSTQRQFKKVPEVTVKSKSKFKTNKIHDFKTQIENNGKIRAYNGISENRSKRLGTPVRDDRRSSIGSSSMDLDFGKSSTSLSEISYKEKIRDKFNAIKERTIESMSRPHSRSHTKFNRQESKKIEDSLKQEEFELSVRMRRHEEIKKQWQRAYKASLEEVKLKDGFFTDDEDDQPVPNSEKIISSSESKSSGDNSKVLTSDLLGFNEDWDLVEFVKPEKANPKNDKLWNQKLFYPSTKPVSLESKLEPGLTPRFLEEEGIFVGRKIEVPKHIKNKVEQRILMTPEGRRWFSRDGELISSSCPLKMVSTRPFLEDDTNFASRQLTWKPATSADFAHRYMDVSGTLNYVLDIEINAIEFSHHPLFSKEHVLAQRLKELYIKYKKRKEIDTLNRLNGRLDALRRTRNNLKSVILEGGDNLNLTKELEEYENEVKEVREMRYVEGKKDKELKNKILSTWKDLLKLREQLGYQSTSIKLNVKKKNSDSDRDQKAKWESDLKQEIKETLEELKSVYKKSLAEYKENYALWNQKNRNKIIEEEAEDSIEKLSENESAEASDVEEDEFEDKEPKRPKPVVPNEVKAKVVEKFKESFYSPDEPELEFAITKDTTVEATSCNNKEEMRIAAVKRSMVFVKLYYNGKEVCRSKSHPLSQKFTVKINQRFAIRILEWPESLMLEIHEETGSLSKNILVPGIYLPLPDSFTTVQNSEILKHEFSSDISTSYYHAAVGSGNEVIPCPDGSDFNNQPVCLYTSGTVVCRVGWVDDNGKILAPTEKSWNTWNNIRDEVTMSLSEALLSGGAFDVTKLKEWVEKAKLDPNDPYNAAFFHFLENAADLESTKPTYFRLNPLLKQFDFCSEKYLESNTRLKVLKLRDSGEPEFSDMKMVPLNEKQIPKDIFKDYEKRISMQYMLTSVQSTDPIDGHRAWGKKYLEQVQKMLLKQCLTSRQNKRYHDIIAEESVPDIGTLGLTFMKWLRPKRPLRPVRKERKKITSQNFSDQEVKIVVNVVRAFEVPVRKDMDAKSISNGSIDGFPLVNVRPFVEISFQGTTARTTAAEGANPTWNQDLQISVSNKNGQLSAGKFQSIKDTLYLHLFDEIVIDLIEDESARETNIHQRLERHWLASMEIPFSTLYFNSRIEGTFKLYSPPILLGYEREAHRLHFSGATGQEPLLPQRDATYISLFVTVQPTLNPPQLIKEKMECSEASSLEKHLEGWVQEVADLFPNRKVKALVLDITGKYVSVTRFVRPLPLPPILEEEIMTPELLARYVAMIPLESKNTVSSGFFDIWLNGDQVLRLLSGDSEDHAILLCCYFLKLGLQAYVLLGSGIPHGSMGYVLVKETIEKSSKYYVWDPTNGQKYSVDDSFCPLQKIWANVQVEEMPRRTKFDLNKRAEWFPAFSKSVSAPSGCAQSQYIDYRMTSRQAVDILQDKLEKKLRDNLMKWRKKKRTLWNRYCAATLRKLLPNLERSTWNLENHSPDHVRELQHILASHKMCGFPINMAFTRIEAVTEAVKATGVHSTESDEVEFALAVYVHPYPNNVLSVWVYVASLIRRR